MRELCPGEVPKGFPGGEVSRPDPGGVAARLSWYRLLFDQAEQFAGIVDLEGTLLEANQLSVEGCGFSRSKVIGEKFWDGPWWQELPEAAERIRHACREASAGRSFAERMEYRRGDGKTYLANVTVRPILDAAGNVVAIAPTGLDVTDQVRAESALKDSVERFETLANNIVQFAWMADAQGSIFWYNDRWYDYTGTTLEQMQGWGWTAVHHPDHVDRVVAKIQRSWETGQDWEDTFPLRGRDGRYRWFLSRAIAIRDQHGRILRWFGTNTDVTEIRDLQEELRQVAVSLSEANRRKNEFLALLAHELRNPLAPIRSAIELLRLIGNSDEQTLTTTLDIMGRQVNQMVSLIDDLLDVNRISRGTIELRRQNLDVATVVQQALDATRAQMNERGHRVSALLPEESLEVHADPTRLAQIIGNLLNNACKFTPVGGAIAVHVEAESRQAVIRVADNGIGLTAEETQRIFELFSQADRSRSQSQGGLGIGLSLVRSLVELHGGSISVTSAGPGAGAEFIVRLPLAESRSITASPPVAHPVDFQNQRILIVDDNRDAAVSLQRLLQELGAVTDVVHTGFEALSAIHNFAPACVLLDLGLPGLNGFEVCREIRTYPASRHILIVAASGWGQPEDRERTRDAGFDAHLVKPIGPQALTAIAELLVRRNSAAN